MHTAGTTRIVLITGASRGIGAAVARQLARRDTHVVVNYRDNDTEAESVVQAVRRLGGSASAIAADIADPQSVGAMVEQIGREFGRVDVLVLTASTDRTLNGAAQARLAELAMPLMPVGGQVIFVTSHQAHFFPHKGVPKGYAAVAASKRVGETALYAMRSEFSRRDISFTVTSGEIEAAGELATATASAATTPHPPGIVFVGGPNHLHRMSA